MKKMTSKVALSVAMEALSVACVEMTPPEGFTFEDVQEKLGQMMAQLEKKKTSSAQTKAKQENEELKEKMLDLLGSGTPMRATEVAKALDLSSGQKASNLLNAMEKEGRVVKSKGEKGATLFSLPDPDEE
jgi:hypothetical protein